jgi:hypothetical protein
MYCQGRERWSRRGWRKMLHFFYPNPLNRYSLGTKNKTLKYDTDGSLTLYAGAKSPGADKESNWLPAPNGSFSLSTSAPTGRTRPFLMGSGSHPSSGFCASRRGS